MIVFKHEKDKDLFYALHTAIILIYVDMANYAEKNFGKEIYITQTISTPEQDKEMGRISDAHQLKIAIDIGTKNLDVYEIQELLEYINNKKDYEEYRYLSYSGVKRLAYFHDNGHGEHIHTQIHKKFALRD